MKKIIRTELLFTLLLLMTTTICLHGQVNQKSWTECKGGTCVLVTMSASKNKKGLEVEVKGVPIKVNYDTEYTYSIEVSCMSNKTRQPIPAKKISIHARAGNGNVYYPGLNPDIKYNSKSHSITFGNNGPSWIQGGVIIEYFNGNKLHLDGNTLRIGI